MNFLVVDDEKVICEGMERRLIEMGIAEIQKVYTAYSAGQALSVLRSKSVDVLITDIQMEGENGLQLISEAQKLNPDLSCVVLTAFAEFDYAQRAIQLGVLDFIVKPSTELKMRQTVLRVIEKRKSNLTQPMREPLEAMKDSHPIAWACQYVRSTPIDKVDMAVVANELNMSYHYFSKQFKKEMGVLFSTFVTDVKMQQALRLLRTGESVNAVSSALGYLNVQNFTRAFKTYFDCTPSRYYNADEKADE